MTPQGVFEFLFSPTGRVSRRGLTLGILLPFLGAVSVADYSNSPGFTSLVWLAFAWPLFVATPWKRMHDQGRTGKWNLLFLFFYVVGFGFFLAEYVTQEGGWAALFDGQSASTIDDDLSANGLGGFSTVLIFLPIHLFWLYLIPSQDGRNRYGPAPRR